MASVSVAPLLDDRQDVCVGDVLLDVRQGDHLSVDPVQGFALDVVAQRVELLLEAAPPRQFADGELAARQPDGLRGHDFVRERVLDDAVLVDAGLVGEGVGHRRSPCSVGP